MPAGKEDPEEACHPISQISCEAEELAGESSRQ